MSDRRKPATQALFDWIGKLTTGHPWGVLGCAAALTLVALTAVSGLRFDASFMGLLPDDDPRVELFREVTESFGGTSNLLLFVDGEDAARTEFLEALGPRLEALEAVRALDVRVDVLSLSPPPEAVALPPDMLDGLARVAREHPDVARALGRDPGVATLLEATGVMATRGRGGDPADVDAPLALLELAARAAEGERLGPVELLSVARDLGTAPDDLALDDAGRIVSRDGRANLAVVRLETDVARMAIGFDAFAQIEQITAEVATATGVRWGYAGSAAYGYEDQQNVLSRLGWMSIVSLVLVLVLFLLVDRSPRIALLVGVCMGLGLIWTFALVRVVLGHANLTSAVFGVLLFGLSVDFAVHLIVRVRDEELAAGDLHRAIRNALRLTGPGVLTGGMTTSLAFFALLVSDQPATFSLGFTTGVGLLCSLAAMIVVFPALLAVVGGGAARGGSMRVPSFERWTGFCVRHPGGVLLGALVVTLGMIALLPLLRLEYDVQKIATQGTRAQATQAEIEERFAFSADNGLCVVDSVVEAARVVKVLRGKPGIRRVESVADLLPTDVAAVESSISGLRAALLASEVSPPTPHAFDARDLRRVEMAARQLALMAGGGALLLEGEERAAATRVGNAALSLAEAIEADSERSLAGLAVLDDRLRSTTSGTLRAVLAGEARPLRREDLPKAVQTKFFDDRGRTVVYVQPEGSILDGARVRGFLKQLETASGNNATGAPVIIVILLDEAIDDLPACLLAAALSVTLLLVWDYRRLRFVLLTFLPLALALVWAMGVMAILGRSLNILAFAGIPLIFGIGVDDGVHLVHRYREEGDAQRAAARTGRAIFITTITTLISFGSLLFLNHVGLGTLGLLVGLGVALCFLGSVTVFPAAVTYFRLGPDGKRRGRVEGDGHEPPADRTGSGAG